MNTTLLYAASILTAMTGVVHSALGEKRLIGPLLMLDAPIVHHPVRRPLIRFAWHATTILFFVIALLLWRSAANPEGADPIVLAATGIAFLIAGLWDGIVTRFRHIGWPALTGTGILTLLAL